MDTIFATSKNGTQIFVNEECHPHLLNEDAKEAISKMIIPEVPADQTDRSQTRVCETIDLGKHIGFNHRVKNTGETTFTIDRGLDKPRGYESLMILKEPTEETMITSVVIWFNNKWYLLTNHEGIEDMWPEPGSERFSNLSEEDQDKAIKWHRENPLAAKSVEVRAGINKYSKMVESLDEYLHSNYIWIPGGIRKAYEDQLNELKELVREMTKFESSIVTGD